MYQYTYTPKTPLILGATCLLLFILSAVAGLMVAYVWDSAFEKFIALALGIVAAIGLASVGYFHVRAVVPTMLAFGGLILAGMVMRLWLQPESMEIVTEQITEPLIILLPLTMAWLLSLQPQSVAQRTELMLGVSTLLLILLAGVLIWHGDASSGVALLLGTLVTLWLAIQKNLSPQQQATARRINYGLLAVGVVGIVIYLWMIVTTGPSDWLGQWMPDILRTRLQSYRDFLSIVRDYPFTGSGLGVSEMVYSSYLFMVQVPFQAQAHNLFLQIAVEQGIPGLVGYVGLLLASFWALYHVLSNANIEYASGRVLYLLAAGTLGSLITLNSNGLLDADIYSSRLVPLFFLPIGGAWAIFSASYANTTLRLPYGVDAPNSSIRSPMWAGAIGAIPFLLVAAMFFLPGGYAAVYANAGAISQTQAELSIYADSTLPIQDVVRLKNGDELAQAKQFYNEAIALNPYNVTAQWRLGQIALAQGNYVKAEDHLRQAHVLAPQHRAVSQLLGEVYAVQGQAEKAVQLWQPLDMSHNQLQLRLWWYEMIGDESREANYQEAIQLYEQNACCR